MKNLYFFKNFRARFKSNIINSSLAVSTVLLVGTTEMQSQVTYSFTTAGATGQNGPSQGQVTTAYQLTNLNGSVVCNGGIQSFTIPASGPYRITAGGAGSGSANNFGGRGRIVQGDIVLPAGTVLQILVGQKGTLIDWSSSGGGGSYVVDGANNPIIIGGGGGGYNEDFNVNMAQPLSDGNYGQAGNNSNDGTGFGGAPGSGGTGSNDGYGGGGGGFNSNGTDGVYCFSTKGISFLNGGQGGNTCYNTVGGFGGGAGTHGFSGGGGGGGGYSGGGGSTQYDGNSVGGGGGSFQSLSMTNLVDGGLNLNDGFVTIEKLYGVTVSQNSMIPCFGQSVAVLTGVVGGGVAPYTYTWMPAGGNGSVATGLGAGVYTCSVTDANNEVTSTSFTVTQPALLTGTINNVNNATCYQGLNGSAHIAVSGGVPAYQYFWVPNGSNFANAFGLGAGNYSVYVIDANGCQITKSVSITQGSLSLVATAASPSVCAGSSVTLFGNGVSSYSWSTGATSSSIIVAPSTTTNYVVAGTNSITGCTNTLALTITVKPLPVLDVAASTTLCSGQFITLGVSGASTYTWLPGNLNGFFINVSPNVTTTYTVSGTSADGCVSANSSTSTIVVISCVGIEENTSVLSNLQVYPNPTTSEFVVEVNNGLVKSFEMFDVTGRNVLSAKSSEDKTTLNISNLSGGVYYLKVQSDKAMKVVKLIKQ